MNEKQASRTGLEKLAGFVHSFRFPDIADTDLLHMKYDLLDSVGCTIYGATAPWSQMVARFATTFGGKPHSSIWGSQKRCNCRDATLANGTAAQAYELDNSHTPLGLHLGCSVVPASVSVAEMIHASGKDLLESLICGYEVAIRIRGTMDISHILKGFNSTGTCGGFGAAAAVGKLIGLDENQLVNAMGIAGVNSVGIQAAQFSMAKRLMGPRSAEIGLSSAFLAAEGYTGTRNLLEAKLGGFFESFSDQYDIEKLAAGLGDGLVLEGMGIKPYPSSHGTHAALDAASALLKDHAFSPEEIRSIEVRLPPHAAETKNGWEATDIPSALHDVRFTVAVMLTRGRFSVEHLTEDILHEPIVEQLMSIVRIMGEPAFGDELETRWTGQMTIELADGRRLESETIWHPRGTPSNPFTWDDVVEKFMEIAPVVVGSESSTRIVRMIEEIEELDDVNTLTAVFAPK